MDELLKILTNNALESPENIAKLLDVSVDEVKRKIADYEKSGIIRGYQAIVNEEVIDQAEPAEDLLSLEGMDKQLAFVLASRGIVTREDLAEQAVDEIEDIEDLEPERAAELIMAARAHWFEDEQPA